MSLVQMDYDAMERMVKRFRSAGDELDSVMSLLARVADVLDEGALLGEAGSLLSDSTRDDFIPGVLKLRDKLDELADDVHGAMVALRDSDEAAKSRFSD